MLSSKSKNHYKNLLIAGLNKASEKTNYQFKGDLLKASDPLVKNMGTLVIYKQEFRVNVSKPYNDMFDVEFRVIEHGKNTNFNCFINSNVSNRCSETHSEKSIYNCILNCNKAVKDAKMLNSFE